MRYQLFITVCSMAFISASAGAYDASPNNNTVEQDYSAAGTMGQQQNMLTSSPRSLPVARDGEIIDSIGGGATEAELPVARTTDGIRYITGGIGDEESAEINAQEHKYNARVLLIATNGEYMSEIAIRFLDKDGKEILRADNVGPFFYAVLPDGKYTVEAASASGALKSAKLAVPSKNPAVKTVIRFDE